jgi:hypothetical protein
MGRQAYFGLDFFDLLQGFHQRSILSFAGHHTYLLYRGRHGGGLLTSQSAMKREKR